MVHHVGGTSFIVDERKKQRLHREMATVIN
jgi:hypothetical protein